MAPWRLGIAHPGAFQVAKEAPIVAHGVEVVAGGRLSRLMMTLWAPELPQTVVRRLPHLALPLALQLDMRAGRGFVMRFRWAFVLARASRASLAEASPTAD
eukprot:13881342-Alexandrium_andersonii.AAC.1